MNLTRTCYRAFTTTATVLHPRHPVDAAVGHDGLPGDVVGIVQREEGEGCAVDGFDDLEALEPDGALVVLLTFSGLSADEPPDSTRQGWRMQHVERREREACRV